MANVGQSDFQHSTINVVEAPIYERNFVRIMAMMAVPPDGNIYDVYPKNGIKPMYNNKYDQTKACFGVLDIERSYVDDDARKMYLVVKNVNTLSDVVPGDGLGIYVGGTAIIGVYHESLILGKYVDAVEVDISSINYDIYHMLKSTSPLKIDVPVWAIREYDPQDTTTLAPTTTEASTTEAPALMAMVMDYYVDWSGGMNTSPVANSEYAMFSPDETVSVKLGSYSQVSEWRKLCNATGISINIDTANKMLNATFSMGIITKGYASNLEPRYWILNMGNNVYLRVYLNMHEINYRMLGKYYLNIGQGHDSLYLRDTSVYGDLDIMAPVTTTGTEETYDALYTITTPSGSEMWADFWDDLLNIVSDPDIFFEGELHMLGYNDPYWYPCQIKYSGTEWTALFTVDPESGFTDDTNIWGDIIVSSMIISRTVSSVKSNDETYATVTFTGDDDVLLSRMDIYDITHSGETYTLWWDVETGEWRTSKGDASLTDEVIIIKSHIMSYDSMDFSTGPDSDNMFRVDNAIYPERPYYFRLKFTWQDIVCYLGGVDAWVEDANIHCGDELQQPRRYGIYALSHYSVDSAGRQTRIIEQDAAGNSRYSGIYGRNYLCRPADTYPSGMSVYPAGTRFCTYYPPCYDRLLLTRASGGVDNYIEYSITANTITFDLRSQVLGTVRNMSEHATHDLQIDPSGSTLTLKYKKPGISGNGFVIDILLTEKADTITIIGPVDNVLKIFVPPVDIPTNLLDIHNALNPRMDVDYGITSTLTIGSGEEAVDNITENMVLTLSNGGDEMIISNNPLYRNTEDVYMHPGYMFNGSRRQSPVNMVGIYAVYLSANYSYANGYIDVIAIDKGDGIDLYAAVYSGDPLERYTLIQDISPKTTEYTDPYLSESYAECAIGTDKDDVILTAKEAGWVGNGIKLTFEWRSEDEWLLNSWDPTKLFLYQEDVPAKEIVVYVQTDTETGLPLGELTSEDLKDMAHSRLVSMSYGDIGVVDVSRVTYYLSGGGGSGGGAKNMFIHYNGYMVQLNEVESGEYKVTHGVNPEERWLFSGSKVDLLAYKLENKYIGEISNASQHDDPNELMWDIECQDDYSFICAMIDERKSLEMINYIDINGHEIEVVSIDHTLLPAETTTEASTTEASNAGTITITTTLTGNKVIKKMLKYNDSISCSIKDMYFAPQLQAESITKSMIYYGKFMPKISVQIPSIEEWGPTLVPYYIVRLSYGTVMF